MIEGFSAGKIRSSAQMFDLDQVHLSNNSYTRMVDMAIAQGLLNQHLCALRSLILLNKLFPLSNYPGIRRNT